MDRFIALQKIIDLNSFTKAGEALGYTQSSMSQMISSLEEELSIKLLHRSRVGVKLTLEGEELYPFIQKSIFQYQSLQEKAKEIKGLETGTIRIGTLASISCHWMPKLLKGFQELYPKVQFILHQGDYSSIQEWIKVGAVDFGFMSPDATSGLEVVPLKEGDWLAVLPKNHILAKEKVVNLKDIANYPYILLEEGHYSEPLEAFKLLGLTPKTKYCIHDDYAILSMVEEGLGVSILAELILKRTNYNVICIPTNPTIKRKLAICYKDKASLPISSKYFIKYLKDNLDELP